MMPVATIIKKATKPSAAMISIKSFMWKKRPLSGGLYVEFQGWDGIKKEDRSSELPDRIRAGLPAVSRSAVRHGRLCSRPCLGLSSL